MCTVFVCMPACQFVYIYVCMYLFMFVRMCVHACMFVYVCICVYERIHVCVHVFTCVCMYLCVCVYVHKISEEWVYPLCVSV